MNARDFYDACLRFDWFYEMSDDHTVWRRGNAAKADLLSHAPIGSENRTIWDAMVKHHYSGPPWNTLKSPMPDRPAVAVKDAPRR